MATRTVGDLNEEGKREAGEAAALDDLRSALVETVSGQVRELAARLMESPGAAAVVDGSIREAMLEAGRRGLEHALEDDQSDCGAANAPLCGRCGGGRMRYVARERSRRRRRWARFGWRWGATGARPAGRARVLGKRAWTSRRR